MDFWGHVYNLRRKDLIPREWSRDHLRPHLEKPQGPFSPRTVTTVPSNLSTAATRVTQSRTGSRPGHGGFGRVYSG